MKIAIIGSGISGLGAAYLLAPHHAITIFEKNNYAGGHSRTIDVKTGAKKTPVDTGFIVFNNWNYPNLLGLFKALGVPYEKSDMSFGVSIHNGWLEYSSNALFAQKANILRPSYWLMLRDVLRFNKLAPAYIEKDADITLGQCLQELKMGDWFCRYYILAMGAAIWSCPVETIMEFPARTFLLFFKNHGLLSVNNRPQWYTVSGGSRVYVQKILQKFPDQIKMNSGVQSVRAQDDGVIIKTQNGSEEKFNRIIFACHADEAMNILENPTADQKSVIGTFRYQSNTIITHHDTSFMPRHKKCWASWVYLSEGKADNNPQVSLTYWMNNLQNLDPQHPIFVTLNPGRKPDKNLIVDEHQFTHPVFDRPAIAAQSKIAAIQGQNNIWFCGAYQRYGFHEDGLLSAVHVAKSMNIDIPWE